MQLSIQQTASILGKTRRQLLYMIEQGKIPAKKVGGRWVVERDDLHLDPAQQQRATLKTTISWHKRWQQKGCGCLIR